ncbi:recombinase family protein [Cupriavidus sp. SW-Y-13]|uniref:recombinase family protein n=1 Tax=Cupriavidus sp. SW-Y-13 TaxID=2653854 RepID=UPI0013666C12|nr:recombinase family protein [Cupriavidus sp. SW-Y-13]MWL87681.1 recombinase family protein [Cupriavidus sp. SW-Y-13]
MSNILYTRVSDVSQSVETQRQTMQRDGLKFDKEFSDEGVSGAVLAANRPGFAALLSYVREGDVVHVYAVDRLGRDAIDVQTTIRALLDKGVQVDVRGLGLIGKGVGELIVAVLAQVAEMERNRIRERTAAGRDTAKAALAATGKTHRGKESLGRPVKADAKAVAAWRMENAASISATAKHFGLSESTIKRYVLLSSAASAPVQNWASV